MRIRDMTLGRGDKFNLKVGQSYPSTLREGRYAVGCFSIQSYAASNSIKISTGVIAAANL
jgi:hypothetical protein